MNKIPSFQKNHDLLLPGFYFSTYQKGVSTFDLRFKKPNANDFISPKALHSIEHMLATALRNGPDADNVIYFGPMGCRTGFYLLTVNLSYLQALKAVAAALKVCESFNEVPGAAKAECGNYTEHDLAGAKRECAAYLALLNGLSEQEIRKQQEIENIKRQANSL